MANKFNKQILEQYLLGMLKDDSLFAQIEEKISVDDAFATEIEILEDELIEKYTNNQLIGIELQNFEKFYLNSKTRKKKIAFTKAINEYSKEQLKDSESKEVVWFWSWLNVSPKLAFSMAMPIILFAILGTWFFIADQDNSNNYITQIESLNENNRTIQARIIDFKYLPHRSLRGDEINTDASIERKHKILESKLLVAVETEKSSESFNNLGVLYLTEKGFGEAIKQFEEALRIAPNNTEARSNLGAAYFEKSNITAEVDEKLKLRAMAFDEIMKAIKQGDKRAELLFNRALILQAMNIPRQAIEAWKEYLEKDNTSKWADEARKNLEELEKIKSYSFKTKEVVFNDFIDAFQKNDKAYVWKIHSQTKEVNAQRFIPLQLARSYLNADQEGNIEKANLYLKALNQIGELEKEKNADVFFSDLADYYSQTSSEERSYLHQAHRLFEKGLNDLVGARHSDSVLSLKKSRNLFLSVEDVWDAALLDVPLSFGLTRTLKLDESNQTLDKTISLAREKKYKWLLSAALDWKTSNVAIDNELSSSLTIGKESLKIAEETENIYQIQRMSEFLAQLHSELGETRIALKYLAIGAGIENKYNENERQAWRNQKGMSLFLGKIGLYETAIVFGNEYVYIADEIKSDRTLLKLSYYLLSDAYILKGEYGEAKVILEKGDQVILNSKQEFSEKRLKANSKLISAEINRKTGNCKDAIADYEFASELYSKYSKYLYENFTARKGLLFCYSEQNNDELLEAELETILEMFERNRNLLNEEKSRNSYFHSEQTIYDIAIEFSLRKKDKLAAFNYSEASKARSLLDFIQNGAEIKKGDLNYKTVAKPLSLVQIQQRMPDETQLIQYAILPKKIVIWIIKKESLEVVEQQYDKKVLNEKVSEYLKLIKENNNNIELIKARSNNLYELLISPVHSKLDADKNLFIVSDKFLHRLPFASLFSSKAKKYLIEDFTITNAPSATIFILKSESAEKKPINEKIVSIGNPTFNREENPYLDNLISAKKEATEISELYKNKKLFSGDDATKNNFINNFTNAEIVHFAGHYVANQDYPLNSKLLMAKTNVDDSYDLRVLEIAAKKNNNLKLVVLSACQTDVERFYNGEGAIGAARIFLGIGSPVVVASYFGVDSDSTADLMINFHKYRKNEGLSIAKALQKAQINALSKINSTKNSPFYWSAFSPTGGYTEY